MANKGIGAYVLTHLPTGIYYVGSTNNFADREYNHRSRLNRGVHPNARLQACYTKWADMELRFIPAPTIELARVEEQKLLKQHHGKSLCCNVGLNSTDPTQGVITKELRQQTHQGNSYRSGSKHTDETKARIGAASKGRTKSDDVREKIAAAKRKTVSVNGELYDGVEAVVAKFGVSYSTVLYRIASTSSKFESWFYK